VQEAEEGAGLPAVAQGMSGGGLHDDDVGTGVDQQLGAVRPGDSRTAVDHPEPVERRVVQDGHGAPGSFPRITVPADENQPPVPFTQASSAPSTCRGPPSPLS
jgi:hypothetical protein